MRRSSHQSPWLLRKLDEGYARLGLSGTRLLLAVSGGADSSALLVGTARLAAARRLVCTVASVDHGLRPEGGAEVEHVRALAERFGLPFVTRALGLPVGSRLEERAREARYEALEQLRQETGCAWIVTAHTADDQAETLLMRLARGAALRGAAGILGRRGHIVRPMLRCTRADVRELLEREGLQVVRDPMNEDPTYLRPRVRARVLPALTEVAGAAAIPHLAAFSELAQEDEALLGQLAEDAFARLAVRPGMLDGVGVRALVRPIRLRVLRRLLESSGVTAALPLLEAASEAVERGGRIPLRRGIELRAEGGWVRCVPRQAAGSVAGGSLRPGERIEVPALGAAFTLGAEPPPADARFLPLPPSVPLPLTVRGRLPGDLIAAGPRGGHRKLQDVLVDLRIPAEERDRIPVVADASGNILWVVGVWPRPGASAPPASEESWYLTARPLGA